MATDDVVLAIDLGTSSVRVMAFDVRGVPVASRQREYPCYCPHEGFVEQQPEEVWAATLAVRLSLPLSPSPPPPR
jgi:sugar (pentulose or hexulose) kinase